MVIDSSALIAILENEAESKPFRAAIRGDYEADDLIATYAKLAEPV